MIQVDESRGAKDLSSPRRTQRRRSSVGAAVALFENHSNAVLVANGATNITPKIRMQRRGSTGSQVSVDKYGKERKKNGSEMVAKRSSQEQTGVEEARRSSAPTRLKDKSLGKFLSRPDTQISPREANGSALDQRKKALTQGSEDEDNMTVHSHDSRTIGEKLQRRRVGLRVAQQADDACNPLSSNPYGYEDAAPTIQKSKPTQSTTHTTSPGYDELSGLQPFAVWNESPRTRYKRRKSTQEPQIRGVRPPPISRRPSLPEKPVPGNSKQSRDNDDSAPKMPLRNVSSHVQKKDPSKGKVRSAPKDAPQYSSPKNRKYGTETKTITAESLRPKKTVGKKPTRRSSAPDKVPSDDEMPGLIPIKAKRSRRTSMPSRLSREVRKSSQGQKKIAEAVVKIQALGRGFVTRMEFQLMLLERRIRLINEQKARQLEEINQRVDKEIRAYRRDLERKKARAEEEKELINLLKRENARLKKERKELKRGLNKLQEEAGRLRAESTKIYADTHKLESANKVMEKKVKEREGHLATLKNKWLPKYQKQYRQRQVLFKAETRMKSLYETCITDVVDQVGDRDFEGILYPLLCAMTTV